MKCTNCDGRGAVQIAPNVKGLKRCPVCDGSGEVSQIEQTNEEWFCQLPTEEKAKWLENKMTWAAQEQGTFTAKGWEKWLKEIHKE